MADHRLAWETAPASLDGGFDGGPVQASRSLVASTYEKMGGWLMTDLLRLRLLAIPAANNAALDAIRLAA